MVPPGLQCSYGLDTRQSQQFLHPRRFEAGDGIGIPVAPYHPVEFLFRRIDPFEAHGRNAQPVRDFGHRRMQQRRKGMGCVHQQPDAVFLAERGHSPGIHRPGYMSPVMALDALPLSSCRVKVGGAGGIGDLHRNPPFRSATEDKYHWRKRCLNSWA